MKRAARQAVSVGVLGAVCCCGGCTDRSKDPVVRLAPNDSRLVAAQKEAHDRWPEFVALFRQKRANTAYAVKRAFPIKGGSFEHMWVQVSSIEGESITGVLDNEPVERVGLKVGDTVTFPLSEMEDWLVAHGKDDITGAFSLSVVKDAMGAKKD